MPPMTAPALSTMWTDQPRFANDLRPFARLAASWGFEAIEVSHVTSVDQFDSLLSDPVLPVVSVHLPAPRVVLGDGRVNLSLNLAATDEDERMEAVRHAVRSLEFAGRAGARAAVVHMGGVAQPIPAEAKLRRLFDEGLIEDPAAEALRAEARRERADLAASHLEAATRSLEELILADSGMVIGLENRFHYHEIPLPDELDRLLDRFPSDQVGSWLDVGHAVVLERLGLVPLEDGLRRLDRAVGSHLHEVDGIRDHRAPGHGDVDWSRIAPGLPGDAIRTLEIAPDQPEWSMAEAVDSFRRLGLLG